MRRSPALAIALAVGLTPALTPLSADAATTLPAPEAPRYTRTASLQSGVHGDRGLATAVAKTLATSSVTSATVGVAVRDMTTGHLIQVRNPSTPIKPASTAKSRTVSAGLGLLGASYTWHTDALARGAVSNGALAGPIVLKGYGDPTLMASDLAALAQKVRAAGITSATGIVTDDTWFDAVRRHPTWDPAWFGQYYAAPISALTLSPSTDYDAATVIVTYAPGSVGGPARVATVPASAAGYLKITNKATTGSTGTGDTVSVYQPVDSANVTVSGSIASGLSTRQVWKIAPSPQMYVATVFKDELRKAGVTVTGGATPGRAASTDRLLGTDRSAPLSQAIKPLLKLSDNMMAEHVLKTISAQSGGGGTWADGTARVAAWMRSQRIPMAGVNVVDGSGLSHSNRETAMSESTLLWAMRNNTAFYDALPVAGNPDRMIGGTLRNRLVGTAAANNLHAKTGTLTGVTALSGYVRSADSRRLSMSMLSMYPTTSTRPVENSLALTLARWNGTPTSAPAGSTASLPSSPEGASAWTSEWDKRTQ